MASELSNIISILKSFGFFEIYLPFFLTFAIFYGLLKKTGVFKGGQNDTTSNKVEVIVAGVAAAYVVLFSPASVPITQFFATFFTQSSLALVSLLVLIMIISLLLGLAGVLNPPVAGQNVNLGQWGTVIVITIGVLAVAWMFFTSGGSGLFNLQLPGFSINVDDIVKVLIIVSFIGLFVYFWRKT